MFPFFAIIKYGAYYINAHTEYNLHSPFMYDFYTKVIRNKYSSRKIYSFADANYKVGFKEKRLKSGKYKELLFRIVKYSKPQVMLEIGTSADGYSQFLVLGNKEGELITLGNDYQLSKKIQNYFQENEIQNVKSIVGDFNIILPAVLEEKQKIDLILISKNNREKPIPFYFSQCLPYLTSNSIFIIENIHYSRKMEEAWETIKQHPKVKVTVDLFSFGIVFFKEELSKQHFILRF